MKVLVCGGRDFNNSRLVANVLAKLSREGHIEVIIHGGATGADTLADRWAKAHDIPTKPYPVSKEDWARLGKKAGPIRNSVMLADSGLGDGDVVVAFPGGDGTADMIAKVKRRCLRLLEPKEDDIKKSAWNGGPS